MNNGRYKWSAAVIIHYHSLTLSLICFSIWETVSDRSVSVPWQPVQKSKPKYAPLKSHASHRNWVFISMHQINKLCMLHLAQVTAIAIRNFNFHFTNRLCVHPVHANVSRFFANQSANFPYNLSNFLGTWQNTVLRRQPGSACSSSCRLVSINWYNPITEIYAITAS